MTFPLQSDHFTQPYTLELQIDDKAVKMEVDTGASLSIISLPTFRKFWPRKELRPSNVRMKTYTGETLLAFGSADVEVKGYGKETAVLPLLIVEKEGPSLLGRNWLNTLNSIQFNLSFTEQR